MGTGASDADSQVRASAPALPELVGLPALIVTDGFGVITAWNDRAEEVYGWQQGEVLGRRVLDVVVSPEQTPDATEILSGVTGGVSWAGTFRLVRRDGSELRAYVRDTPVHDSSGAVIAVVGESWPVSDLDTLGRIVRAEEQAWTAQRRLSFLAEASAVLDVSLDYAEALQQLATLCVPYLGDNCLVDVLDNPENEQHAAIACIDGPTHDLLVELRRRYPPTAERPNPAMRVAATGRGEVFTTVPDQMWERMAQDSLHLEMLRRVGLQSGMTAPLQARGRVFGAISVGALQSRRVYGPEDLALLEELGLRAGVAIDNARLYSTLAQAASDLQEALLPPTLPAIPGIDVAARYVAAGDAQVGGDFYDVFDVGGGAWAACVGDVCGKGPRAAATTGMVRATLRALAAYESRPEALLAALNRAIVGAEHIDGFSTVAYVHLEPAPGGIRLLAASAGHPLPLLIRAHGAVESFGMPGTLLGVFSDAPCTTAETLLEPGDAILLYTDGVVERRHGQAFFGDDGLATVVRDSIGMTADGVAGAVQAAVQAFQAGALRDDMAVVVLRVLPAPALTVAPDPPSEHTTRSDRR